MGLSYIIGLTYGIYLVLRNQITLGDLVSFNMYLGMIVWPMFAIGELINVMQRGGASLERIDETLNAVPDVQDVANPAAVSDPGLIEFNNVTFRYPSSTIDNLTGVSLSLSKARRWALSAALAAANRRCSNSCFMNTRPEPAAFSFRTFQYRT